MKSLPPDRLLRSLFDAAEMLARRRCAELFSQIGDIIETGPTRTNVNDFRAILISAGTGAGHKL